VGIYENFILATTGKRMLYLRKTDIDIPAIWTIFFLKVPPKHEYSLKSCFFCFFCFFWLRLYKGQLFIRV